MAIGERIRWFRNRAGMTQKELGIKLGFGERTADIRIRQYETGTRNPKADMIKNLARIFDVAEEALTVPDIDTYQGLMHTLFTLEDLYGLTITRLNNQVCLTQNVNHPNYDVSLSARLLEWCDEKAKVDTGGMHFEEYDQWRYSYPAKKVEDAKARIDAARKEEKDNDTAF